ncbi:hypothetical protein CU044_2990 [Streptomyces sp. L-9-10]|uniref:DUF1707 SHOCT-like domain-containing protein n=1 Tax=Streptomyces sp. L-9-10 TaxID=1478131 RepID=UPI00101BAF69|nr:DUF1707 domain-containing protein [Streptomyces sp. L-9-10]RYJ27809.1 hypothetical protein CU044_2990 [Streptomyces sp. L-9-10]
MTSDRPDTPPCTGPDTRASDAERERVAARLREAVAEGRLDMEEFDERLEAAFKARTHGELAPLVRDLPAPGTTTDVALAPDTSVGTRGAGSAGEVGSWQSRIGREPATSKGAFAFWGGFRRRGTWTVARRFTTAVFMGGGEIDLREARFEDRDVVIRCFTIMGGVHVTVPPDLDVEVRGFGLMGGFGESGEGAASPGSPRVIISGFALMGGVGVERKVRESEKRRLKEERRRQKLEKKADRKELD